MSTWSSWQLNIQRSNADQSQFHVYRGMKNGDNWDYDTRTYPRSLFSELVHSSGLMNRCHVSN